MSKPSDRRAKVFVRDFLASSCGVTLKELEREPGKRTVDFEMRDGVDRVLVAELKTLVHPRPSVDGGWTMIREDEKGYEAYRTGHHGPSRIAKKTADAHGQLAGYARPWAVILHNEDFSVDVRDFHELFEGERVLGVIEGRRIVCTDSRKVTLGHTLMIRGEIDLYIWVDQEDRPRRLGVWWATSLGEAIARRYFGAAAGEFRFPAR